MFKYQIEIKPDQIETFYNLLISFGLKSYESVPVHCYKNCIWFTFNEDLTQFSGNCTKRARYQVLNQRQIARGFAFGNPFVQRITELNPGDKFNILNDSVVYTKLDCGQDDMVALLYDDFKVDVFSFEELYNVPFIKVAN